MWNLIKFHSILAHCTFIPSTAHSICISIYQAIFFVGCLEIFLFSFSSHWASIGELMLIRNMRDDWKLAATSQNSFAWKTLNLFFYLKSAVRVLLAHSQRIRRNYAHTRQRHIHIDTATWWPLHLPFMHDHVNIFASRSPRSRLPLLTFPVAFFLVAASRGRRRVDESLWVPSKNIFNSIFSNCSVLALSLSLLSLSLALSSPMHDEYAYVLTARCSYAPRYACGPASPLFRLPQSQMNIFEKNSNVPSTKFTFRFCIFCGKFSAGSGSALVHSPRFKQRHLVWLFNYLQ